MNDSNRRDFLKFGAAFPMACHALAARADEVPRPNAAPKRVIFICNSLGFYRSHFFPSKPGDLGSSRYLNTLPVKDKATVFLNLYHPGMETSNHDSEKSFLTGAPKPEAANFVNTVSVDQVLARCLGRGTRFPSLSFSIYDRGWGCSWDRRGAAIPPMHDTDAIFEKLFRDEDVLAKRQRLETDRQIFGGLYRDIERMKAVGDTGKLDTYRAVLAELEASFQREQFWLDAKKPNVPNTLSDSQEYVFSTKIQNLLELAKLALQTDSTRVITLSLDWIYGAIKVPGATGGWHTLSHHGENPDLLQKLTCVEMEIVRHLSHFVAALDAIPEGNGTLLDHTTVVVGSNFGDSSNHTCNNLPTLVVGGGHRHQGHKVFEQPTHLCDLWLELLHKHDVDVGEFGSSKTDQKLLG